MKQILKQPGFHQAIIRTAGNIVKLGGLAGISVFTSNLFKIQAKSTIQGAQMDYFTVSSIFKGR